MKKFDSSRKKLSFIDFSCDKNGRRDPLRMVHVLMRYTDAERFIIPKQNGLCRSCKQKFNKMDTVVSAGQIHKKYYHEECAKQLHIV
jgi:hypothetical protein